MKPLVSVWMITYNHAPYIAAALDSIVSQDYPHLRAVVADDGSTDGTYSIVEAYAARFPGRIRALPPAVNRGVDGIVDNANRALAECDGDLVAFLEGDDLFLPGKIGRQVAWFDEHPDAALCGHDVEIFDSTSGRTLGLCSDRRPLAGGVGPGEVIRHGVPFCTASIMVRRRALPAAGFDSRLRMVLDWKLWIDVLTPDRAYGYIPGIYARYRRHATGVTSQSARALSVHATSFADLLAAIAGVEAASPDRLRDCAYARGRLFSAEALWHLERGNSREARRYLRRAMVAPNGRVRARAPFWWALSFLPTAAVQRVIRRQSTIMPVAAEDPPAASVS